jgi:flotillin
MISFVTVLMVLVVLTLLFQVVTKMKIVGANEIAVIAGKGPGGFSTLRGGRVFVFPLIHRFYKMDLRPQTATVSVESAIAEGIVPLTVVATVSFTVASSNSGVQNAIRRILTMTYNWNELRYIAGSIIEGHLRDSIATMTPEQVMTDKDILVQNMIRVCKLDLEGIGLEITTMNIADVDDHRLEGIKEPDLYIALLKRIQGANAETQAREARALTQAASKEANEARRAEVSVRKLQNEKESLEAETRVRIATEKQRSAIGVQKAARDAEARVAGIKARIEAEQRQIEMLRAKFQAELLTPAEAEQERLILAAKTEATKFQARAQAEIDQLKRTIEILQKGGPSALQAYIIENFEKFIKPFAQTLNFFPVKHTTVITGANKNYSPISAVHPHPIEEEKARLLKQAFGAIDNIK